MTVDLTAPFGEPDPVRDVLSLSIYKLEMGVIIIIIIIIIIVVIIIIHL